MWYAPLCGNIALKWSPIHIAGASEIPCHNVTHFDIDSFRCCTSSVDVCPFRKSNAATASLKNDNHKQINLQQQKIWCVCVRKNRAREREKRLINDFWTICPRSISIQSTCCLFCSFQFPALQHNCLVSVCDSIIIRVTTTNNNINNTQTTATDVNQSTWASVLSKTLSATQ